MGVRIRRKGYEVRKPSRSGKIYTNRGAKNKQAMKATQVAGYMLGN